MSSTDTELSRAELEARKNKRSKRKRTPLRRFGYVLGLAILKLAVRFLWWSYRVEKVIGQDFADEVRHSETPYAPCLWHGQLVLGGRLIHRWVHNGGYKACFVVSASVDGDVPSKLANDWGARVIRGSSNNAGAHVLRDMKRKFREGYSIVTAADGPNGPNQVFKEGVALMARVANVPMVPMAFAADRQWNLRRWDNFMIPKPFARIVIAFGEPVIIPKTAKVRELEPWRIEMENAVNSLTERSNAVFADSTEESGAAHSEP